MTASNLHWNSSLIDGECHRWGSPTKLVQHLVHWKLHFCRKRPEQNRRVHAQKMHRKSNVSGRHNFIGHKADHFFMSWSPFFGDENPISFVVLRCIPWYPSRALHISSCRSQHLIIKCPKLPMLIGLLNIKEMKLLMIFFAVYLLLGTRLE